MIIIDKDNKFFYFLTFFSVFGASMLGVEIFGVSLNKVALIPLEIYLIIKCIPLGTVFKINKLSKKIILWFLIIFCSSIIGLMLYGDAKNKDNILINNIIQVLFIYIPILFCLSKMSGQFEAFIYSIEMTAIINAIWSFIQFGAWTIAGLDINDYVFNRLLGGALGNNWSAWSWETGSLILRTTGLTHDPALFSISLIIAFCFCRSKLLKVVFFVAVLLSQSRAAILAIIIATAVFCLQALKKRYVDSKKFLRTAFFSLVLICIGVYLVLTNELVANQIDNIMFRFRQIGAKNDVSGTSRHILYLPCSIYTWLFEQPIVAKFFGSGIRTEGLALANSIFADKMLIGSEMKNIAWAIESDFAENLLGIGILGFINIYGLYFELLTYSKDIRIKVLVISLLLYGIMYNLSFITIVVIFFLYCCTDFQNIVSKPEIL